MRWYTCTPVEFSGGPDFFARDSGLLSRGFQSLGIESRAVMPGEPRSADEPDLIRTEYRNLASPEWWRSHRLDGVVLYAWGRPKYRKVAAAIRKAGIFLVLNQDNAGLISPLNGFALWAGERRARLGAAEPQARNFRNTIKELVRVLFGVDPLRAWHLRQGDIIACVSPVAAERYRRYCGLLGGAKLRDKVRVVPHPVNPLFSYDATIGKQRRIVAVGRWDDHAQKRPDLMQEVFALLASQDVRVEMDIIGVLTKELRQWHDGLVASVRERIHLLGRVDPVVIADCMRRAQIVYCSSAHESFHIASGEGLCSGCSVVAARSPSLSSFEWFTTAQSGRLADEDAPQGHVQALMDELASWEHGGRCPNEISKIWKSRLQASRVAEVIAEMKNRICVP